MASWYPHVIKKELVKYFSCDIFSFLLNPTVLTVAGNSGVAGGIPEDRRDRHPEGTVQC